MRASDRLVFAAQRVTVLSVAFHLIDDYTGRIPDGRVEVAMEGRDTKAVRNKSGDHLFLNLPDGEYQFVIAGSGFRTERTAAVVGSGNPVSRTVRLKPLPSYPFPGGVTLLRGIVLDRDTGLPLPEVRVGLALKDGEREAFTDQNGEFVLYLPRLKGSRKKVDGKYLVKGSDDTAALALRFVKEGWEDGAMFVLRDGDWEQTGLFSLEVGKELRVKKLLWGGY